MKPEGLTRRTVRIGDWDVAIVTYRIGEIYYSKAQSCPPEAEACMARASGGNREAVENQVEAQARSALGF